MPDGLDRFNLLLPLRFAGIGPVEKRCNRRQHLLGVLPEQEMIGTREHGKLRIGNEPKHFHCVLGPHAIAVAERDQDLCLNPFSLARRPMGGAIDRFSHSFERISARADALLAP